MDKPEKIIAALIMLGAALLIAPFVYLIVDMPQRTASIMQANRSSLSGYNIIENAKVDNLQIVITVKDIETFKEKTLELRTEEIYCYGQSYYAVNAEKSLAYRLTVVLVLDSTYRILFVFPIVGILLLCSPILIGEWLWSKF